MLSINEVRLTGNLTRDPELKYLPSGMACVNFSIANNDIRKGKDGEKIENVCFVEVAAFGKTAEVVNSYFTKGKPIYVSGKLKFEQWEKDGVKRSKLSVLADRIQFMDSSGSNKPAVNKPARTEYAAVPDINEEEIPF